MTKTLTSKLIPPAGLLCATVAMSGCTWMQTTTPNGGEPGKGIAYYLPMQNVEATYSQAPPPDLAKAETAHKAAQEALKTAKSQLGADKAAVDRLNAQMKVVTDEGIAKTDKIYKDLVLEKSKAVVKRNDSEAAAKSAQAAETKAKVALDKATQASGTECFRVLSVRVLPPQPDVRQRYTLNTHHKATRTEAAEIKTSASGLLTTVDAEVEDQTADVIINLAAAIAAPRLASGNSGRFHTLADALLGDGLLALPGEGDVEPPAREPCPKKSVTHQLNPIDQGSWQRFSDEILVSTSQSVHAALPWNDPARMISFPFNATTGAARVGIENGLVYRRQLPLHLRFCDKKDCADGSTTIADIIVNVPNHSPTEVLPASVGLFGKAELDIGFSNGLLVKVNQTRPSEAASAAQIPFDALAATGKAISQIIQLRIDRTDQMTELSESDLELLKANEALREALEQAESAKDIETVD